MGKLVYKVENGSPTIIEEDKQYDFDYTETAPPEGIYSPFFFDGVEWIGTTKEDYENNNPTDVPLMTLEERMNYFEYNLNELNNEYKKMKELVNQESLPQA